MARKMEYGKWAQVIGTFDLGARRGSIASMQPAKLASASLAGGEERVRIKGFDASNNVLFDLAVNPMKTSCGVQGSEHMFEEFVPVTDDLVNLKLFVNGVAASEYSPGKPPQPRAITLESASPEKPHRVPLASKIRAEPNVSYTVQVRPQGDTRWHTMAVGLAKPDAGEIDINQFPGATALEVRILQSDGLSQTEVFRERREF